MLYEPVHFAVFLIICCLLPLLIYISFILVGFYIYLKEAYIETVLNRGGEDEDEEEVGLTRGGRRISM